MPNNSTYWDIFHPMVLIVAIAPLALIAVSPLTLNG